jgi:ABC-type oligopeptide transport system substrate-binding subunit
MQQKAGHLLIGAYLQNRYRLDAELGQGGMGAVYRARDTLLDRPVALKVLNAAGLGAESRVRLLREARAAARLNHPNITAIFDAGEAESTSFIVMELLTGSTLRDRQPSALDETREIARQICLALEHAHAHGIIHRDLKPENVMLLSSPSQEEGWGVRVKLMDFGLAFHSGAARLTQEGALVGTITYLAPELIEGKPATAASDLYALGVILYELVARRPPFVGDTLMMVLSQHLYAPVVPPSTYSSTLPPALDRLIVRLLSKRPEDRPASAAEVRHALETVEQPLASALADQGAAELSSLDRIVRGRLVARERELAEARQIWQRAAGGEGQVLLISGEPGIGKTRFARELMAQARFAGALVLLGECYAEGGAPYTPLAQVIQTALDPSSLGNPKGLTTSVIADLLTLAPALRTDYPDVPPNPPLELQAEQQRIFEHVVAFLAELSHRAPVLLVIDDAHWADSATLALLRHTARRSRRLPLLIVLTYREIELDEARPFNTVLFDLNRERLTTRLKLTRFDRAQTRSLLATLFQEEITGDFLDGIYRETEGNPFFIEEVCKALIEEGKLSRSSGRWQRPAMSELEIPQNVRLAIQARVSKLSAAAQDTLRLAAVLGREFEFDTLRAMSDLDEDALIEALETAQRAQLIDEAPRSTGQAAHGVFFAFAHALIPTTLHDGLSGLRRQRLHRRAAQALERVSSQANPAEDFAAQLGRHYAQAGEGEKAIPYLLKAGDQARSVYAYEEAIGHYQQALAFLKEQGAIGLAQAARTAMNLGTLHHTLFNFDRSRAAFQEAFELWQRVKEVQAQQTLLPAPHALRRYWSARMGALDPGWRSSTEAARLVEQLFSGLVELSADFDIVPALARSWELSEDGRQYLFHLRRDARWSDGTPLTAHDFEFAWKRVLDPATAATESAAYLFDIKGARALQSGQRLAADEVGVRALDDFTLRVELEEPVGHFLHLLAHPIASAVPRHKIAAHGADWTHPQHIVTHGPFRLESWTPNETIVLARDPDYCGQFSGNLARIELTLGVNVAKDVLLDWYAANQSDHVIFGATILERLRQRFPAEYQRLPAALTTYLAFDATRPPFDDARVRRALAHAIDRRELTQGLLQGASSPALGGLTPPGLPGHTEHIGLLYDPARAQQLLAEAGYPGGRGFPEIVAAVADAGEATRVTNEYLSNQWRDLLSLRVTWNTLDVLAFQDAMNQSTPHLYRETWTADYPDPDDFLRLALHQPHSRWRHEHFEQLLESARRMTDAAERLKFYQAADRLLMDEAGVIPLAYGYYHCWLKPWIKRFPVSPLKTTYWKDVVIEPH